MENNKNIWQKAKVAVEQTAAELEQAERGDEIREKEIAAEREAMEAKDRESERVGQPEKIWVSSQQINTFLRRG